MLSGPCIKIVEWLFALLHGRNAWVHKDQSTILDLIITRRLAVIHLVYMVFVIGNGNAEMLPARKLLCVMQIV